MLNLVDVEIFYGRMEVIKKVSVNLKKGELVSIIGPNGAGKTTLIKAIMGLKEIKSGKIIYEGNDISKISAWERAI